MSRDALSAIHTQVMWNRLIAVVEEQAQALLRTAFGSVAREAGDLSAGVYNLSGLMLAQAVTGTPGHVNTMATAVSYFLERYPVDTMRPGDVFVTNDPWMGTGHLFDFVVVTPAFREGQPVGLFASTCHVIDVGGVGFSAEANSVFEEGTLIPHLKLRDGDGLNEDVLSIICANTRNPVEVRGDILSLVSCNDTGTRRLTDMMDEFAMDDLDDLAEHILTQSRTAAQAAITEVPDGVYTYDMPLDGYERPINIATRLTVAGSEVTLDYSGSSPASIHGINSPRTYTHAYSVFGLKAVIAPHVPNNAGSLDCFGLVTEPGTCVDPQRPSPVTARHVIGQMLPDAVFGCLAQALPDRVPAGSAGSIWVLAMASAHGKVAADELAGSKSFNVMNVGIGGAGARPGKDGLSATAFPSGVGTIPVEITETQSPIMYSRKEYLIDSGGPGAHRGGLGQLIEVTSRDGLPFTISAATFDRIKNPASGRAGGAPGGSGQARLASGPVLADKGVHVIDGEDGLIVELPGGGGFGPPVDRLSDQVQADLESGLISPAAARDIYGSKDGGQT